MLGQKCHILRNNHLRKQIQKLLGINKWPFLNKLKDFKNRLLKI